MIDRSVRVPWVIIGVNLVPMVTNSYDSSLILWQKLARVFVLSKFFYAGVDLIKLFGVNLLRLFLYARPLH